MSVPEKLEKIPTHAPKNSARILVPAEKIQFSEPNNLYSDMKNGHSRNHSSSDQSLPRIRGGIIAN